jgi:hypothetical protein
MPATGDFRSVVCKDRTCLPDACNMYTGDCCCYGLKVLMPDHPERERVGHDSCKGVIYLYGYVNNGVFSISAGFRLLSH